MEQDRQGKKTEDSRLQGGGEVVRRDVGVLCGQLGEREDPDSHGGLGGGAPEETGPGTDTVFLTLHIYWVVLT